ncbi:MAG: hypothetical protein H7A23_24530 [Leptospiraceae bacterium]|nr:hypothetical protein [Leptospiraceae bacterium]MCP5497732.1 hypothetical protein [Leptospiraceae bacterium]
MTIKKLFIIVSILLVLVIGWFAFGTEDEETRKKKEKARGDVALLLGGSTSSGSSQGSTDKDIKKNKEESIFESDFYSVGKVDNVENSDNPEQFIPKGEIPINPQTGQPYTEEVMQQFEELRKKFPNNDLLPRRMTPEEKEAQKKDKERVNQANLAIRSNKATLEDINLYYDSKEKEVKDRLQIVNYLVDSLKEAGESDETGQIDKILKSTNDQLEQLKKERDDSLKKIPQ